MEVKALQQILTQFRQMQETIQRQVDTVHVEASAGGGMVIVKMNGQKHVTEVRIEPEVFAAKDAEMLQELVRAAVNEASRRVDEEAHRPDEEPGQRHARRRQSTEALPGLF